MLKFARKYKDLRLEGKQARHYDAFSRKYRKRDFQDYAVQAAKYLGQGASVLEIASGPGYFCIELARLGDFKITGLDISSDVVDIARANAVEAAVTVDFIHGSASDIQFPDGAFNFVFCSWAFKNFMQPAEVLKEVYRVLKPEGTALIVDLDRDASREGWRSYAADHELKGMTSFLMRIAFTIQRSGAYSKSDFEKLLADSPYQRHEIHRSGINLFIRLTK
jgi:ubiquinone/menaquinone biosynthesis C-methylase UbiE